ncbi:hypothetical protein BKI52_29020 [marine bacterium AO1-C]|nr:hypothetical protein BKI52_29020 [marine bacterium AO1-C]
MKQIKMYYKWVGLLLLTVLLNACVGEDVRQDSVRAIEITTTRTALLIGQNANLTASLKNPFGDSFSGDVSWVSSTPAVATIDASGILTAVSIGQTRVTATAEGVTSNELLITVVSDANSVATIVITAPSTTNVGVGSTLQLTASARDVNGNALNVSDFTWTSSSTSIATVDQNGLVTGVADGVVTITASANNIDSQAYELTIGSGGSSQASRTAQFAGSNGYRVSGDASLAAAGNGIKLSLGSNFSSQSGPGLYLYLSNSSSSVSGGVELGKLRKNSGSDEYTVDGVALDQYKFVIVYCKPFGAAFGFAEFGQ